MAGAGGGEHSTGLICVFVAWLAELAALAPQFQAAVAGAAMNDSSAGAAVALDVAWALGRVRVVLV